MKWRYLLFAIAVLAGVLLRLPRLDLRPMHVDEAVHAIKFGDLLERHAYRYDPVEYHGPTLNYFTLLPAYLTSETTLIRVHECHARIVPVFFGVLLILLPLLVDKTIPPFVVVAALSYRRLAGHGVLQPLLYPGNAPGLLYVRVNRLRYPIPSGTKDRMGDPDRRLSRPHACHQGDKHHRTGFYDRSGIRGPDISTAGGTSLAPDPPTHVLVVLLCAAATSVLFFSSFLTNWQGVADSLRLMLHTSAERETRLYISIPGTIISRCCFSRACQADPSGLRP